MTAVVKRSIFPAVFLASLLGMNGTGVAQLSQDRSDGELSAADDLSVETPAAESALPETATEPAWRWETADPGGVCWPELGACGDSARLWLRGQYLLWWTEGNPLPALVSTSPQDTPLDQAGIPGTPGYEVLFGDQSIADEDRGGGWLTFGYWFDDRRDVGLQVDWFLVGNDKSTGNFVADSDGTPILAHPFENVVLGQPAAALVAFPDVVAGEVGVSSSSELYSAAVLLRRNWRSGTRGRIDLLGGYRLFGLREDLTITDSLVSTDPNGAVPQDTTLDSFDLLATKNQFHGGEFGLTAEFYHACWSLNLLGKVALGNMHQELNIDGITQIKIPGQDPIVGAGGLLTQPANIGRHRRNEFAVLPELGVNLQYHVTERFSLSLGYTLVCLNTVLRIGDQIDTAVSPAQRAVVLRDAGFWAQGVSFGLQLAR
jgi:hypothetical protein